MPRFQMTEPAAGDHWAEWSRMVLSEYGGQSAASDDTSRRIIADVARALRSRDDVEQVCYTGPNERTFYPLADPPWRPDPAAQAAELRFALPSPGEDIVSYDDWWSCNAAITARREGWDLDAWGGDIDDDGYSDEDRQFVIVDLGGEEAGDDLLAVIYDGREPVHILARKIIRYEKAELLGRCRLAAERGEGS